MKYLKTFENYSVNEEELFGFGKQTKSDKEIIFYKTLYNTQGYSFNRESLIKQAKDDNFRGNLEKKGSELIYVPGKNGGYDNIYDDLPNNPNTPTPMRDAA